MTVLVSKIYSAERWFEAGQGPRYQQLRRYLTASIVLVIGRNTRFHLSPSWPTYGCEPSQFVEQFLRLRTKSRSNNDVSGHFRPPQIEKLEQSLSSLVSFSENIRLRARSVSGFAVGTHHAG